MCLPEGVRKLLEKASMAEPFIWDALIPDDADQQTMVFNIVEKACGPYLEGCPRTTSGAT